MSNLVQLVDRALRDPLAAARDHARHGGRVIGYVGSDIPVELIYAANAFPLRLPSFAGGTVSDAELYLESGFMPEIRSILQQCLQGDFDFVQAMILPRSNDSAQRLYYYLSELRRRGLAHGPEPLIFDLAKIPRDSSRVHSRAAVARLAEQIHAPEAGLRRAIAARNRRRTLFAAASEARLNGTSPWRGSLMDRMFRAAEFCDADLFDAKMRGWLQTEHAATGAPRVLLAGSAPPDERLHVAVESGGGNVVAELGDHASRGVTMPLIAEDASFAGLADHYQSSLLGQRAFVDRGATTLDLARSARVQGVINYLLEEEDVLIWNLPAQNSALASAGVASLALSRRRWDGDDGALREISRFTAGLESSQ